MKFEKIIITYWCTGKIEDLPYEHRQEFSYSLTQRNKIIKKVLENECQIMLNPRNDILYIHIDNRMFKQR